jgi:uncharacterized membrane protein
MELIDSLLSNSLVLKIVVIVAALAGFLIAYHIRHKKQEPKPFVCPLNFDCHAVVNSDYSKILGVPLELIGMAYYAIVALSYTVFAYWPSLAHPLYVQAVMYVSVFAFLFSLYLTYVQAVKLKQWCTYCLFSASMCTVIFLAVLRISLL